jgi:hypothetical protein
VGLILIGGIVAGISVGMEVGPAGKGCGGAQAVRNIIRIILPRRIFQCIVNRIISEKNIE